MRTHGLPATYRAGCKCEPCTEANAANQRRNDIKRKEKGLPDGDPRHGTTNGYRNYGCRCKACKAAHSAKCAAYSASDSYKAWFKNRIITPLDASDPKHGTMGGYRYHRCRCDRCKDAARKDAKARNDKKRGIVLPPGDPRHGRSVGYNSYACRCKECMGYKSRINRARAK